MPKPYYGVSMSGNSDPKPNDVSDDAHGASAGHGAASEKSGSGSYILLFLIIGLALGMVVGWAVFPKLLYSKKSQPVDFNHKLHLEQVSDSCNSCHFFREDGSFSGAPTLAQCVDCHDGQIGESDNEALSMWPRGAKCPGGSTPVNRTVSSSPIRRISLAPNWHAKPAMEIWRTRKASGPMRRTALADTAGTSGERTSQASSATPTTA
jgi:hypothetical protein